jgi:hypothetical protein
MTEAAFGAALRRSEGGLDLYDPANTAPLVAWLCSADAAGVTGQVFELLGGRLSLALGWTEGPAEDRGARWQSGDVGAAVRRLVAARPAPKPVWGA